MPGLMDGKRVLVTGPRNKWSIAWHTALALHREGAKLAFSVLGEGEESNLLKLMREADIMAPVVQCDAGDDAQVASLFERIGEAFDGKLDGLVHAMAFANSADLRGEFGSVSSEGFALAHEISVYSLLRLSRAARPLLNAAGGGSIVTLSYLGAERVVPNYNIMGVAKAALEASVKYLAYDLGPERIRVNAISAGPIKTLSAKGIANFDAMRRQVGEASPLRRPVEADEVGDATLFLLSTLARGITGEILHVDGGYNTMGMMKQVGE
jgi:enoyl-[acyl-carrier protein] reductase I